MQAKSREWEETLQMHCKRKGHMHVCPQNAQADHTIRSDRRLKNCLINWRAVEWAMLNDICHDDSLFFARGLVWCAQCSSKSAISQIPQTERPKLDNQIRTPFPPKVSLNPFSLHFAEEQIICWIEGFGPSSCTSPWELKEKAKCWERCACSLAISRAVVVVDSCAVPMASTRMKTTSGTDDYHLWTKKIHY